MLMVAKVVAVGATALVMGGTPAPASDRGGAALSASPVASAELNSTQTGPACPSGCNVWRMIYDGRR
ncbi:hypothetical protein QTI51_10895 [Variovorax sp. J22G73]|jgi:hypothetical protein|uniref:hypothetical protein n=1 Tax=unclassified Variovorax TaxID=663243 RepID=UPI000D5FB954|nr:MULTISPECIES: hypothetical protein [unclassified Variovorax]MDM0006194.1 hypothetical protein [Variovorax sp. J22R203]MDM0097783.1 hypothetical protein [Variovorax sp. J22G73]